MIVRLSGSLLFVVSSLVAQPSLLPGWPVTVPTSSSVMPVHGFAFADLDGDGRLEIIRPSSDQQVYVLRSDGTAFPGWPQPTVGMGQAAATVADLDGDGVLEILVATRIGFVKSGRAYVFHPDGSVVKGWPQVFNRGDVVGSLVAADLDGDGLPEVIVQERAYPQGYVHVLRHDGTPFPGRWPLLLDSAPASTPAVGDVDGDGQPDVVVESLHSLYVLHADGTVLPGFPYDVQAKHGGEFTYQAPALGDLDGDGKLEIVTACHQTGSGCYVFRFDGTLQPGWPQSFNGIWSYCPPTVVDLDGDGALDVLCGRAGGATPGPALFAWHGNGQALPGFPVSQNEGAGEGPIAVGDIDDDGVLEVVYDSQEQQRNGTGFLWAVDATGNPEPGFPIRTTGATRLDGATLGDVDGDGVLEIGVAAWLGTNLEMSLHRIAGTQGLGRVLWQGFHEGNGRRGVTGESDRFQVLGDVRPGGVLRLEMQGAPNGLFVVPLGTGVTVQPIPGIGVLRVDPTGPFGYLLAKPLGPSGRALATVPIAANPSWVGLQLVLQGLELPLAAPPALHDVRVLHVR